MSVSEKERKAWMSLLAKVPSGRVVALTEALDLPSFEWLRRPEIGGVMMRGRMGGVGARFNLGEMTVTRCAVRTEAGDVGHAYVQGRDKLHAERAALVDALMQSARAEEVRSAVLEPLEAEMTAVKAARAEKAAATKVDFFTMVRGED